MEFQAEKLDVIVIGAGHAGIEAGLAAARLGCRTGVFTINMDAVGNCPCNPSIGGTAKGHLVREIDALGGEMGRAADACCLQSRMLNRGKGPAVHSLRAQIDRRAYATYMKHRLELEPRLTLRQGEIVALRRAPDGVQWECVTRLGAVYTAAAVVLATGTFLAGKIYVGDVSYESGPDGMFPAAFLSDSLRALGVGLRRFKTGTPARVRRSSIDFSGLEPQEGDDPVTPFSYDTARPIRNRCTCYMTWTNAETRRIIQANIHRSPLYSGKIEGIGPRYCPSLEDKIVHFPDKERHQLFLEPCGADTEEIYVQGASSSLPEDVQLAMYRTIRGLSHVEMMRVAYAIEYDCVDPQELSPALAFKRIPGLSGAGQFNGSSGYEDAAAQGVVAGINAARYVQGKDPLILPRSGSYIGTLIDDLVTKGVSDPYRMMTSRSEYRLVLRQDNADERLTPTGRAIGLVTDDAWARFRARQAQKQAEFGRVERTVLSPTPALNAILTACGTAPVQTGARLSELLRRPQIHYADLTPVDPDRPAVPDAILEQVEIELKYDGYIRRQQAQIEEQQRLEARLLPQDFDYRTVSGLRLEAQEKLNKVQPRSLGQASRISGVSPADISVLIIHRIQAESKEDAQ